MLNRIFDRPLKSAPSKVLIVSYSNPGDVILSMPSYRRVQRVFPDAAIDIVVGHESEQLMKAFDLQGCVIVSPPKKTISQRIRFFSLILKSRYDLIIDLRNSYFGLAAKFGSGIFSPRSRNIHRRDGNLRHLDRLGVKDPEFMQDAPGARRVVAGKPYCVSIAPGSKSDLKRYPASSYATLADSLIKAGCMVSWVGSQSDAQVIHDIQNLMNGHSECLAGKLSWKEFRHHLEAAHLLITNDSAPLHLADDIGCPVIALFGPTDHKLYGPQRSYSLSLKADVACRPCGKAQCQKKQRDCLELISPETIFNEAIKILEVTGGNQRHSASGHKNKKILLIRLDRIGDVLLSLPAVANLKLAYPESEITMMVRPYAEMISRRCPLIDRTVVYDYKGKDSAHKFPAGYFRFLSGMRKQHFDEIIVFHATFRSHLLAYLIGAPKRTGFVMKPQFFMTHSIPDTRKYGLYHESRYVNSLTGVDWNSHAEQSLLMTVTSEDIIAAKKLLRHNEDFYVFHVGASAPSKKWPLRNFSEVAKYLLNKESCRIVLVGGSGDRRQNEDLKVMIGESCIDLTGKTSIPVLAAVMKLSKGVLSNDSGPTHIAGAVNARVLSIFGRNEPGLGPKRWSPLKNSQSFIWSDYPCQSCLSDHCKIQYACLDALAPEQVFKRLLQRV